MMGMRLTELRLVGTTAADGSLTVTSNRSIFGLLYAVEWVDGTLDNGVSFTLSAIGTPSGVTQTLLQVAGGSANDDAWWQPRNSAHSLAGAIAVYTNDNKPIRSEMLVINGSLQLVIAAGGNAKTGGAYVYLMVNDSV